MAEPRLTGLRRQVLDQVDACDVWLWVAPNRQRTAYLLDNPTGPARNRTAAVAWLITAGLIAPPERMETGQLPELTAAGRALRNGGDPS